MKLNLLPQSVSKAGAAKGMIFVALLLAVLGILAGVGLTLMSEGALATAKADAEAKMQRAVDAKATADHADKQIAEAAIINRSQALSEAMIAHNRTYVDLYADVLKHVPAYYRIDSISAVPASPQQTTVTLNGYLETFRQYADLSVALWKIPDAVAVSRAGYQLDRASVPNLTEADQTGLPVKPGQTPLPTDPLDRMEAMIARAAGEPRGFLNQGNFGAVEGARQAMPGYKQVTMTLTLARNVQTPDPRATIAGAGAAGAASVPPNGFGGVPGGGAAPGPGTARTGAGGPDADGGK